MKNSFILFIALFYSSVIVNAQETTTGETAINEPTTKNNVLVIPFESKMYISDVDRALATKNEMSFQEIKATFRAALDREIFISLKEYYNPLSFYAISPEESKKELAYIYNSIGYKYKVVPEEDVVEKQNTAKKLLNRLKKKKETKQYTGAKIENGEIVSNIDDREKYMNTHLSNDKLILNLNKKHQAKYYIFINELDIKRGANNVYQASEEQYLREIKVHYTIFDNEGKQVKGGAIKTRFPSGQNDVNKIIKVQFPLIAQRIVDKLAGTNIVMNK